jgi:hypothetical protein
VTLTPESGRAASRGSRSAPHGGRWSCSRGDARPLALAASVALAVTATNLVDFAADDLRLSVLNASLGSSWSHRATAAGLASGALVTAGIATRSVPRRLWWSIAAATFVVLFVIEITPVHVQVESVGYGKLIYAPLLAVVVLCVLRLTEASGQATLARAGLAALLFSYAVHVFGSPVLEAVRWGRESWAYQIKVGVKEGIELGGWLLVVVALWRSGVPFLRADPGRRHTVLTNRLGHASKLVRWAVRGRPGPG